MINNNKITTKFYTSITENEEYFKMNFDEFKAEASISIDMKLLTLNSNKYPSSYGQTSADLIKWPLLKLPENILIHHNSPNIYHPQP